MASVHSMRVCVAKSHLARFVGSSYGIHQTNCQPVLSSRCPGSVVCPLLALDQAPAACLGVRHCVGHRLVARTCLPKQDCSIYCLRDCRSDASPLLQNLVGRRMPEAPHDAHRVFDSSFPGLRRDAHSASSSDSGVSQMDHVWSLRCSPETHPILEHQPSQSCSCYPPVRVPSSSSA